MVQPPRITFLDCFKFPLRITAVLSRRYTYILVLNLEIGRINNSVLSDLSKKSTQLSILLISSVSRIYFLEQYPLLFFHRTEEHSWKNLKEGDIALCNLPATSVSPSRNWSFGTVFHYSLDNIKGLKFSSVTGSTRVWIHFEPFS